MSAVQVDLVEPLQHFLDAAALELRKEEIIRANSGHRAVNFFCESLQVSRDVRFLILWDGEYIQSLHAHKLRLSRISHHKLAGTM